MAAFEYKALNPKGRTIKGVIEADTARLARQMLREKGLVPVDIAQTREKEQQQQRSQSVGFQRGISTSELALITRQLATLVQASMPLEECIKAVAEQTEKQRLKNMLTGVRARVVEGYTLSDSLGDYPHVFDQLFRAMVAAGEKSGHLGPVLERLADFVENRQQVKNKLIQAMVYPIVLTVAAIAIVAFLLATVVPDIVGQFLRTGAELPGITQVLLTASDFVTNWGLLVLVVFVGLLVLTKMLLKNETRKLNWDHRVLGMPVIGRVARGLNTSRFARTLSICTSSAIPLLDGMKVAADVMTNTWVKTKVLEASDRVREGASLRVSLEKSKLFPPMMLHMIASGERSGELEQMLTRAADNQDRDFESQVNIALGIFGPLLIVCMAGIVLFIVVATLMPIIQLNNIVGV
ncbi:type II secretion system inner membrane protein GspF [Enterovibrio norvegicus]|uniref:type II secretion system inner membrane protein GspF n=1 Tax=Enterovibrio norvegicus TaxID=188144 RepID=UPI0002E154CB|nr:type II secretion system inner membrane protein GspF [Enterovibrio norvegicus]OEE52912.1 type II secretion system protein GspF [Enterovibrio norvegicus]PMH64641.1 type II secretion system protein GspF [Enterovibrio norvegicus]PMI32800.1 type II secretion system protein GspF [Enterovibrio norvegicus]TKF17264.1 type II secretion system protein GspF [Enterovibrio norvegicus]TKF31499.1 type II secretion system protein GspF [Enterovibrio norvegicus]